MILLLKLGLGAHSDEEGQKMRAALASEKFKRFTQYIRDLREPPSIKNNWDEVRFSIARGKSWIKSYCLNGQASQTNLWKDFPGFQPSGLATSQ